MPRMTPAKRQRIYRWEKLRPQVEAWWGDRAIIRLAEALGLSSRSANKWFAPDCDHPPTEENMDKLESMMRAAESP